MSLKFPVFHPSSNLNIERNFQKKNIKKYLMDIFRQSKEQSRNLLSLYLPRWAGSWLSGLPQSAPQPSWAPLSEQWAPPAVSQQQQRRDSCAISIHTSDCGIDWSAPWPSLDIRCMLWKNIAQEFDLSDFIQLNSLELNLLVRFLESLPHFCGIKVPICDISWHLLTHSFLIPTFLSSLISLHQEIFEWNLPLLDRAWPSHISWQVQLLFGVKSYLLPPIRHCVELVCYREGASLI